MILQVAWESLWRWGAQRGWEADGDVFSAQAKYKEIFRHIRLLLLLLDITMYIACSIYVYIYTHTIHTKNPNDPYFGRPIKIVVNPMYFKVYLSSVLYNNPTSKLEQVGFGSTVVSGMSVAEIRYVCLAKICVALFIFHSTILLHMICIDLRIYSSYCSISINFYLSTSEKYMYCV